LAVLVRILALGAVVAHVSLDLSLCRRPLAGNAIDAAVFADVLRRYLVRPSANRTLKTLSGIRINVLAHGA
jgi:hypothetical protein